MAARRQVDAGDLPAAMAELDAALALDPEFLAAHALRDRLVREPPHVDRASERAEPAHAEDPPLEGSSPLSGAVVASAATVSPGRWTVFEERVRRRRVDRRLEAARAALAGRQLRDAHDAIAEVRELDPDHADLIVLGRELEALQTSGGDWRALRSIAAVIVFGALILTGSWLGSPDRRLPYPKEEAGGTARDRPPIPVDPLGSATVQPAPRQDLEPVDPPPAGEAPLGVTDRPIAIGRLPALDAVFQPSVEPQAIEEEGQAHEAPLDAQPISLDRIAVHPPQDRLPLALVAVPDAETTALVAVGSPAAEPALARPLVPDEEAVRGALQAYRSAYEQLDARSAQRVWPGVDQPALARAFLSLESQRLTFDECEIRLQGASASAVCHGSSRDVPKVGSRDPRVEPRIWSFTLRKTGDDWTIETARAAR